VKPLRILYDFEAFSDQSYGGISRYVLEVARRIEASDDTVVHLAAGWHRNQYLRSHRPAWVSGRYLPAWRGTGEIRRRINALFARRAIARFQPDIIHRTYHRHAAAYPGGHRTVATIHDLTYFLYPDSFPGGETVRRRMARIARTSDHLLCDSQNTREDAIRILGINPATASVVHLGVNPGSSPTGANPIDGDYLLFIGQRSGYKNFSFLIRALARTRLLDSHRLVVFGGGPFSTGERREIESLGIAARVVPLAGDDALLAATYAHASALIYPSLYEGFGLPVLEAMAQGCPVVCSDRSSLPEVGGTAAAYFNPEDGEDSLKRSLEQILRSSEKRKRMIEAGKGRAGEFTWNRCAEKTLAIYRKTVARTD